jgi:hypothetical protein
MTRRRAVSAQSSAAPDSRHLLRDTTAAHCCPAEGHFVRMNCATRWGGCGRGLPKSTGLAVTVAYAEGSGVGLTSGIKLRGPEGAERLRATSASMAELCGDSAPHR